MHGCRVGYRGAKGYVFCLRNAYCDALKTQMGVRNIFVKFDFDFDFDFNFDFNFRDLIQGILN